MKDATIKLDLDIAKFVTATVNTYSQKPEPQDENSVSYIYCPYSQSSYNTCK